MRRTVLFAKKEERNLFDDSRFVANSEFFPTSTVKFAGFVQIAAGDDADDLKLNKSSVLKYEAVFGAK